MKNNHALIEVLAILFITVGGILLFPALQMLFVLLSIGYLLVERRLRGRSWVEIGFKFSTFWDDLKKNWWLILLSGLLLQLAVIFWAQNYFPEFLQHVISRLPFGSDMNWATLLPMLAFSLLGEELTYRSLFQGRLTPFLSGGLAILVASLTFGVVHFASGSPLVVAVDIGLIVVDSILYGIIYLRSGNVLVSWLAHFLADVFSLTILFRLA